MAVGNVNVQEEYYNLFIGCGGTGLEILKEVKSFAQKIGQVDHYAFLALDTDIPRDADKLYPLTPAETLDLSGGGFEARDLIQSNSHLRAPEDYLSEWFPLDLSDKNVKLPRIVGGCYTHAFLGRLSLFHSLNDVVNKLDSALENLNTQYQQPGTQAGEAKVNVFVVSGLGGGTGSGIFLDLARIVRHKYPRKKVEKVIGIFTEGTLYVPLQPSSQLQNRVLANTARSLIELFWHNCEQVSVAYPGQGLKEVKVSQPFDICLFFQNVNSNNRFAKLKEIYEIAAHSAFFVSNSYHYLQNILNLHTEDEKLKKFLSSSGANWLYYPKSNMRYLATCGTAIEMLDNFLRTPEEPVMRKRVQDFLTNNGMNEESDQNNQIQDYLRGPGSFASPEPEDFIAEDKRITPSIQLEDGFQNIDKELAKIRDSIGVTAKEFIQEKTRVIQVEANRLLEEEGAGTALDFLDKIDIRFGGFKNEMENEIKGEQEKIDWKNTVTQEVKELKGKYQKFVKHPDFQVKLRNYWNAEVNAIVKTATRSVLTELQETALKTLKARFTALLDMASKAKNNLEHDYSNWRANMKQETGAECMLKALTLEEMDKIYAALRKEHLNNTGSQALRFPKEINQKLSQAKNENDILKTAIDYGNSLFPIIEKMGLLGSYRECYPGTSAEDISEEGKGRLKSLIETTFKRTAVWWQLKGETERQNRSGAVMVPGSYVGNQCQMQPQFQELMDTALQEFRQTITAEPTIEPRPQDDFLCISAVECMRSPKELSSWDHLVQALRSEVSSGVLPIFSDKRLLFNWEAYIQLIEQEKTIQDLENIKYNVLQAYYLGILSVEGRDLLSINALKFTNKPEKLKSEKKGDIYYYYFYPPYPNIITLAEKLVDNENRNLDDALLEEIKLKLIGASDSEKLSSIISLVTHLINDIRANEAIGRPEAITYATQLRNLIQLLVQREFMDPGRGIPSEIRELLNNL
jgi:hypothetical protein